VLDGYPAPPPPKKKTAQPPRNFQPMSIVAGWIKMPLGTDACLGPGDAVLDVDPAPRLDG